MLYQLIKADAGPETIDRSVPCRSCDQPLAGREGKFVLKYFLLRNAGRVRRRSSALPVPGTDISSPVK
jgi:hypothetical protein